MTRRPDGRFQESITINGKRKFFYGKTKAEVLSKIRAYQEKQELGATVSEIADKWEDEHSANVAYKTAESYKAPIRRIVDAFGESPIKEITSNQIQIFINQIARAGFARRTVQLHLDVLRMIFDYAILHGDLTNNPCAVVSLPRNLKATKRELPTDNDIKLVIENVNHPFGLFPFLLLYTGLRRGEALALTYEDIKNGMITVNKSLSFNVNKPVIKETKTVAGTRTVILPDAVKKYIGRGKGYIFNNNGEPLTQIAFRRRWERYVADTGITCTPHQLRHAYATFLYDAGVDEKAAQELLGHSSIVVTRDIYTHIKQSRRAETAAKLNDFFDNKM